MGRYLRIFFRRLSREKTLSIINIFGLALSIACAILLLLWVTNELHFDDFHRNKDRIYQLYTRQKVNGNIETDRFMPMKLAPAIRLKYSQIERISRINDARSFILSARDTHLGASGYIVDSDFMKIFTFPLLQGNLETSLNSPHSIVITEDLAKRLYNTTDVIGKPIKIDSNATFLVSAVLKNLPINTRFEFEYLIPWSFMNEVHWEDLSWSNYSNLS